jgi:hypothetical protein
MDSLSAQALLMSDMVKSQALTAVIGGFSFASAIAWMDAVRWFISQVVKVQRNGGQYYFLTALLTTLLAVVAYTFITQVLKEDIKKPEGPIYAVGRA